MRLPVFIQRRLRRRPQVYLRPTIEGWWWIGTLILLMLMGWGYTNNLCLALAMLLLAVTVVLLLEAHFNLDGLRLKRLMIEDQFQGLPASWRLFTHETRRRDRRKVWLKWDGKGPEGELRATGQLGEWSGDWRFAQRGRWQQQYVVLRSRYPLGLFEAWSYHRLSVDAWVYPALCAGDVPTFGKPSEMGDQRLVAATSGDEPGELRPYGLGDTPSRIAWKTLAKGLPPYTKTFLESSAEQTYFVWPWGSGDETARSRLAFQLNEQCLNQRPWELVVHQRVFAPRLAKFQRQAALRALAEAP